MNRLDALERRVAELERQLALKQDDYRLMPAVPHEFGPGRMPKCGCPIGTPCGSTACPHLMQPWAFKGPGAAVAFDTAEIDGAQ